MQATVIDLFCGAGGLSYGFEASGFNILLANDFDERARLTYERNHPHTEFMPGSIEDISASDLLASTGLRKGELDVLVGGPPCQAFSVYNHQRGMHDERSGLFREYLRVVEGVRPRVVVMENVTGITSVANGRAVKEIYKSLGAIGYTVAHKILRAEEFGVPQERRRIFFIGVLDGAVTWPRVTHSSAGKNAYVNVSQAIGDLPALELNEGSEKSLYTRKPRAKFQKQMRAGAMVLFNHVAPALGEINQERLRHIPPGGSWRDIPFHLLPNGMKRAKRSDHTKRYGRLHPKGLASTILTKCDLHWGAFIHPSQDRTLTVREAARFQSFPDSFRFLGNRGDQFRQVGNAVPPLLAQAVADGVRATLSGKNSRSLCESA